MIDVWVGQNHEGQYLVEVGAPAKKRIEVIRQCFGTAETLVRLSAGIDERRSAGEFEEGGRSLSDVDEMGILSQRGQRRARV